MPSGVQSPRIRRLRLTAHGGAALMLLFVIAADLGADSRCHRAPGVDVRAGLSAPVPSPDQDPCGSGCVPDCFSCSTLFVGPVSVPVESSGPAVAVVALAERDCRPGLRPLPYHPPLVVS